LRRENERLRREVERLHQQVTEQAKQIADKQQQISDAEKQIADLERQYTSSTLFPYLYDFTLNNWLYYFPNTTNPGHYTTNPRYFSDLTTGKIISM
jgi:hypothetical protein